jgi:hypothetical protein
VRESRHGTPFDAITITNAALLAHLTDRPLPAESTWCRDDPSLPLPISLENSLADEHAAVALRPPAAGEAGAAVTIDGAAQEGYKL